MILIPNVSFLLTELEVFLNIVDEAATRLKKRLDLVYGQQKDDDGRKFSGLHETVLPLCAVARSIFNQLRKATSKKACRKHVDSDAASRFGGRTDGRISLYHWDGYAPSALVAAIPPVRLLQDTVADHIDVHGTARVSPVRDLIDWILVLLGWYRLYR